MMRSRAELAPENDSAAVLCGWCPHVLADHDYPVGHCMADGCDCLEFERTRRDYDPAEAEGY